MKLHVSYVIPGLSRNPVLLDHDHDILDAGLGSTRQYNKLARQH